MNASVARRVLFALATSEGFQRAVRAAPGGTALSWRGARRYVAGTTVDDALETVHRLAAEGITASVDMFGERVTDAVEADAVAQRYRELAERIRGSAPAGTWLSIDLVGGEEAALATPILEAVLSVADPTSIAATVQANLHRSTADAVRLASAGRADSAGHGRLCRSPTDAMEFGDPPNSTSSRSRSGSPASTPT